MHMDIEELWKSMPNVCKLLDTNVGMMTAWKSPTVYGTASLTRHGVDGGSVVETRTDVISEDFDKLHAQDEGWVFSAYMFPGEEYDQMEDEFRVPVRKVLCALIGRTHYPIDSGGDGLRVAPYLHGASGTGKTTLLDVIRATHDTGRIMEIGQTFETTFGLQNKLGTHLVVYGEVKKHKGEMLLADSQLTQMVGGEDMDVAVKNGDTQKIKWSAPMIFAGNTKGGHPRDLWENADNCVTNRLAIFKFDTHGDCDTRLLSNILEDELGQFIVYCIREYMWLVERAGASTFDRLSIDYFDTSDDTVEDSALQRLLQATEAMPEQVWLPGAQGVQNWYTVRDMGLPGLSLQLLVQKADALAKALAKAIVSGDVDTQTKDVEAQGLRVTNERAYFCVHCSLLVAPAGAAACCEEYRADKRPKQGGVGAAKAKRVRSTIVPGIDVRIVTTAGAFPAVAEGERDYEQGVPLPGSPSAGLEEEFDLPPVMQAQVDEMAAEFFVGMEGG